MPIKEVEVIVSGHFWNRTVEYKPGKLAKEGLYKRVMVGHGQESTSGRIRMKAQHHVDIIVYPKQDEVTIGGSPLEYCNECRTRTLTRIQINDEKLLENLLCWEQP